MFVVVAILIVIFVGGLSASAIGNNNRDNILSTSKANLEGQGYTIVTGEINSPAAIETTTDLQYFIQQVPTSVKVYSIDSGDNANRLVAVFNATYGLAFIPEYHTPLFYIWG